MMELDAPLAKKVVLTSLVWIRIIVLDPTKLAAAAAALTQVKQLFTKTYHSD